MYTFKHLAQLHAAASEEMPDSENVKAIERTAVAEGHDIEKLRAHSLKIEQE